MSRVDVRRVTVTGTSFGAGQQTFRLLWNAIFHCRVRNNARVTLLCMSHTINIHPFISYFLIININPLNAELNPICHLLALLGAHHILHIGRIRVNIVPLSSFSFSRRNVFSVPAPDKISLCIYFLSHACYMTHPHHHP